MIRIENVRVETATTKRRTHLQKKWPVVGVVNGFVHNNNTPQTHRFDILVRELLTDEAGRFCIRLRELVLVGLGANPRCGPVVVPEEATPQNGEFGRHIARRNEVRRAEHLLRGVTHVEAFELFGPVDPVLAGNTTGGNAEIDDAIFLAPRMWRRRNRNREFVAEKTERHVVTTELLDDGVELAGGEASGCEFCAHDCISLG